MPMTIMHDKLLARAKDAIDSKDEDKVLRILGQIEMAYRLGAIRRFQYEKLWSMAYPVITKTSIVRKSESEDLKK